MSWRDIFSRRKKQGNGKDIITPGWSSVSPIELIENPERRAEFIRDCERLQDRLVPSALDATLTMYLAEQALEKLEAQGQDMSWFRIQNVGYQNTAEVIARMVEKGRMDFYLSPTDPLDGPNIQVMGNIVNIWPHQAKGSGTSTVFMFNNPSEDLRAFAEAYLEPVAGSEYIPPERIREVFAEIDEKFI